MKSFHLRWASHLPNMGSVFASLYQVRNLNSTFIIFCTFFVISASLDPLTLTPQWNIAKSTFPFPFECPLFASCNTQKYLKTSTNPG